MIQPAYTTRAQVDPRRQLIRKLAEVHFEAGRAPHYPPFRETEPTYQASCERQMEAVITTMERDGMIAGGSK
jgi:hypothetical protein